MSGKERWIMAIILAIVGAYYLEWKILYLIGAAAVIFLFSRSRN
jgi:hypothetical protein